MSREFCKLLACLLAFFLLGAGENSPAQNRRLAGRFDSRLWGAEQGLAAGQIFSIAQGADGYLWLGTEKGLLRFDGLSFQSVPLPKRATNSPVMEVVVDHGGAVWLRTHEAKLLRVVANESAEMVSSISQQSDIVPAIAPSWQTGLLASAASRGLVRLQGDQIEDFHTKGPSLIVALAQTQPSVVWLGTRAHGLYRWARGEYTEVPGTIGSKQINCLFPDSEGHLWVGTDQGLYQWDERTNYISKPTAGTEHLQVLALAQDREGSVWVGTSAGLLRVADGSAMWIQHTALAVTALLADREGDIWFGDGQKLERLREPPILTYELPASITGKGIGAVAVDEHGRVWFAALEGGLYWMRGLTPHKVSVDGLDRDSVYTIDCVGEDVWLGRRRGGLTRLRMNGDHMSVHTWTTKEGLTQNSIYAVRAMSDGSVWAGSLTKGLSHLASGRFQNVDSSSIGSNSVTAIEEAADGSVYVATPAGLYEFRSGAWHRDLQTEKSPPEILSMLCVGNVLLIGTEEGLFYMDRGDHRVSKLESSALHEPVLGIAKQGDKFWLSTTDQLLSATLESATKGFTLASVRSHSRTDGLRTSVGVRRTRSIVADGQGRIYVATDAGLSVIDPHRKQVPVLALAHASSVQADEMPLRLATEVRIPAGTRRTTVNFDGLDFREPEQVRLRYKLGGFDQTWSEPTASRQATYTNLPPGPYTFQVIAQNSQGDWSEQGAVLPIFVEPTLMQRLSVRLSIFVLLLFMAVWIYRARIQFVIARANSFAEERISERNRIARDLHDTLLQGFISVLMHLHLASERTVEHSSERQDLKPVLEMMEQVIEEGRLAVQGLRNADGETPDLESCFSSPKEALDPTFSATYQFTVRGQKRAVHPVVCEEIGRIGKEAITNAFRHAQAHAITVCLEYSRTALDLRIKDDGIGIEADVVAKGRVGHWGLLGMRERAKHVGARFEISSQAGKGSIVTVSVPARVAFHN